VVGAPDSRDLVDNWQFAPFHFDSVALGKYILEDNLGLDLRDVRLGLTCGIDQARDDGSGEGDRRGHEREYD
jgi:hypothetical protein